MKDFVINHYCSGESLNSNEDVWEPFLNLTKLLSYDFSGKFCAIVKANYVVELWHTDSSLLPMISFDCNTFIDKDMYCKSVIWSSDSTHVSLVFLKISYKDDILNNRLNHNISDTINDGLTSSHSVLLAWNILDQNFSNQLRIPFLVESCVFFPGSNNILCVAGSRQHSSNLSYDSRYSLFYLDTKLQVITPISHKNSDDSHQQFPIQVVEARSSTSPTPSSSSSSSIQATHRFNAYTAQSTILISSSASASSSQQGDVVYAIQLSDNDRIGIEIRQIQMTKRTTSSSSSNQTELNNSKYIDNTNSTSNTTSNDFTDYYCLCICDQFVLNIPVTTTSIKPCITNNAPVESTNGSSSSSSSSSNHENENTAIVSELSDKYTLDGILASLSSDASKLLLTLPPSWICIINLSLLSSSSSSAVVSSNNISCNQSNEVDVGGGLSIIPSEYTAWFDLDLEELDRQSPTEVFLSSNDNNDMTQDPTNQLEQQQQHKQLLQQNHVLSVTSSNSKKIALSCSDNKVYSCLSSASFSSHNSVTGGSDSHRDSDRSSSSGASGNSNNNSSSGDGSYSLVVSTRVAQQPVQSKSHIDSDTHSFTTTARLLFLNLPSVHVNANTHTHNPKHEQNHIHTTSIVNATNHHHDVIITQINAADNSNINSNENDNNDMQIQFHEYKANDVLKTNTTTITNENEYEYENGHNGDNDSIQASSIEYQKISKYDITHSIALPYRVSVVSLMHRPTVYSGFPIHSNSSTSNSTNNNRILKEQYMLVTANHNRLAYVLEPNRSGLRSTFPGPMYPAGFRLLQELVPYFEKEDELDIIVQSLSNAKIKSLSNNSSKNSHEVNFINANVNVNANGNVNVNKSLMLGTEINNCHNVGQIDVGQKSSVFNDLKNSDSDSDRGVLRRLPFSLVSFNNASSNPTGGPSSSGCSSVNKAITNQLTAYNRSKFNRLLRANEMDETDDAKMIVAATAAAAAALRIQESLPKQRGRKSDAYYKLVAAAAAKNNALAAPIADTIANTFTDTRSDTTSLNQSDACLDVSMAMADDDGSQTMQTSTPYEITAAVELNDMLQTERQYATTTTTNESLIIPEQVLVEPLLDVESSPITSSLRLLNPFITFFPPPRDVLTNKRSSSSSSSSSNSGIKNNRDHNSSSSSSSSSSSGILNSPSSEFQRTYDLGSKSQEAIHDSLTDPLYLTERHTQIESEIIGSFLKAYQKRLQVKKAKELKQAELEKERLLKRERDSEIMENNCMIREESFTRYHCLVAMHLEYHRLQSALNGTGTTTNGTSAHIKGNNNNDDDDDNNDDRDRDIRCAEPETKRTNKNTTVIDSNDQSTHLNRQNGNSSDHDDNDNDNVHMRNNTDDKEGVRAHSEEDDPNQVQDQVSYKKRKITLDNNSININANTNTTTTNGANGLNSSKLVLHLHHCRNSTSNVAIAEESVKSVISSNHVQDVKVEEMNQDV